MSNQSESSPPLYEINCTEVMDIASVTEKRIQFVDALKSGQPIIINAKQVERVDTSALQLFSAFFHDAIARQQPVRWLDPSDALCRSAALLGLSKILGLNENIK